MNQDDNRQDEERLARLGDLGRFVVSERNRLDRLVWEARNEEDDFPEPEQAGEEDLPDDTVLEDLLYDFPGIRTASASGPSQFHESQSKEDFFRPDIFFANITADYKAQEDSWNPPADQPGQSFIRAVSQLLEEHVPAMLDVLSVEGAEGSTPELLGEWLGFLKKQNAPDNFLLKAGIDEAGKLLNLYGPVRPTDSFDILSPGSLRALRDVKPSSKKEAARISDFVTTYTVPVLETYIASEKDGLAFSEASDKAAARYRSLPETALAAYDVALDLLGRLAPSAVGAFVQEAQERLGQQVTGCKQPYIVRRGAENENHIRVNDIRMSARFYASSLRAIQAHGDAETISQFVYTLAPDVMDYNLAGGNYFGLVDIYARSLQALGNSPDAQSVFAKTFGARTAQDLLLAEATHEAAGLFASTKQEIAPETGISLVVLFNPLNPRENQPIGALRTLRIPDPNRGMAEMDVDLVVMFTDTKNYAPATSELPGVKYLSGLQAEENRRKVQSYVVFGEDKDGVTTYNGPAYWDRIDAFKNEAKKLAKAVTLADWGTIRRGNPGNIIQFPASGLLPPVAG